MAAGSLSTSVHPWHDIPVGKKAPGVVHAVIEIPEGSKVKFEIDKVSTRCFSTSQSFSTVSGFAGQRMSESGVQTRRNKLGHVTSLVRPARP